LDTGLYKGYVWLPHCYTLITLTQRPIDSDLFSTTVLNPARTAHFNNVFLSSLIASNSFIIQDGRPSRVPLRNFRRASINRFDVLSRYPTHDLRRTMIPPLDISTLAMFLSVLALIFISIQTS
jgi:hypothetical protein